MAVDKKRLAGDIVRQATSSKVTNLKREAHGIKEVAAEKTLELRILKKKHARGLGRHRMGYATSEKLEIIKVVESSHLPVKKPLDKLGVISRPTSNRWYDQYLQRGEAGLEDYNLI